MSRQTSLPRLNACILNQQAQANISYAVSVLSCHVLEVKEKHRFSKRIKWDGKRAEELFSLPSHPSCSVFIARTMCNLEQWSQPRSY
eukprot:scaffold66611_cov22-Tisochrysis_lutea.AAC.1